ncbi:small nuclear ribonucleoprotein Sm D2-like [Budorcas taxicolor]|uniref:small nuclear ribonucleoprotein Sm D2-like n=1 Tax=Budorcas taxicolor TaxID=37181 RepID=UPI0022847035|nr:small nuclear ribonucleoprotein Sm D2-like [Budorcas taxicolor]
MGLLKKRRGETIPEQLQMREEEKVNPRPLSVLAQPVKNNTQVPISCHNNRKLLDAVKASDGHCNMVLENAKERWAEVSKGGKGKKSKPVNKDRCIAKMFLC